MFMFLAGLFGLISCVLLRMYVLEVRQLRASREMYREWYHEEMQRSNKLEADAISMGLTAVKLKSLSKPQVTIYGDTKTESAICDWLRRSEDPLGLDLTDKHGAVQLAAMIENGDYK